MKKNKLWALTLGVLVSAMALQSCDDDDYIYVPGPINRPNAMVTVKPASADRDFYLQLDDSTTLTPLNMKASPYGEKEVRAFVNYRYAEQHNSKRDFNVYVNWIDSILTKQSAPDLGSENETRYGNDPVEINTRDWVTIAEDGYLTLRFMTKWGGSKAHYVNLVTGANPDNPYEVTFYHSAEGDPSGYWAPGIVAFRLDKLPDTNGKTVELTLKWKSFDGDRSATIKYCSRKATSNSGMDLSNAKYMKTIK